MQYIVETADIPWRADRAEKRIEEYAQKHSPRDPSKVYKLAYAFYPPKRDQNDPDAYKLPVMDVIDGMLTLIPKAVASAKGYLHGARGVQMHGTAAQKRSALLRLEKFTRQIQACEDRIEVMDGYSHRKGLEGPFRFRSGKVLYYDPREGAYYDPSTDMYLDYEEFAAHESGRRSG